MLVDTLKSIVQTACGVVAEGCGCEVSPGQIHQVENCEFSFPLVAAVHYQEGPVRRMILGCDAEFAGNIASLRPLEKVDESSEPDVETGRGFSILCEMLRDALTTDVRGSNLRKDFVVHDPERFVVRATGGRQFHIELPTEAGRLQLLIGLAKCNELEGKAGETYSDSTSVASKRLSGYAIDFPEDVRNIVNGLVNHEEDVYLRVPSTDGRHKVYHATVIGYAKKGSERELTLTCPCLENDRHKIGDDLAVIFFRRGRLLQFQSQVTGTTRAHVGKSFSLPLVRMEVPTRIMPGQRRDAFRIVPDAEITGKIRSPLVLKGDGSGEKKQVVPFVVRDLSFTGARMEIHSNTLVSGFRWGREVVCTFDLPDPYSSVELVGVVHHLDLFPKKRTVRSVQMGIEFIRGSQNAPEGLERVRKYVLDQERLTLKRRTELVVS